VKLLKFIFRWALRLALALALVVVLLLLFKDALLRPVVERQIRAQTGMEARIGRLETSFTAPVVNLKNLRLYNPSRPGLSNRLTMVVNLENLRLYNTPEFGGSPFMTITELRLEYDLDALRRGRLVFKLVRLNLSELHIVRNKAGRVNLQNRPPAAPGGGKGGQAGVTDNRQLEFGGINTLNLTLGKALYTDMITPANNRETDLGVRDQVFKNIRSKDELYDELYGVLFLLLARHGTDLGGAGGWVPLKL
jgi:uncharacterized protein involved in outer membrane biogenesis